MLDEPPVIMKPNWRTAVVITQRTLRAARPVSSARNGTPSASPATLP